MLQLESPTAALDTGRVENLVEAFPDEDRSFDFSANSSGGTCIFLSVLPPSTTLPGQEQVAGALLQIGEQILAGRTVFPMEPAPRHERNAIHRLADVFVEVVIDGRYKGFQLIAAPREENGEIEVCVSQGFCDFVLGRWDRWSVSQQDFSAAAEPAPPGSWTYIEAFAAKEADVPPPPAEPRRRDGEGLRPNLRRLAGRWFPGRGTRQDPAASAA